MKPYKDWYFGGSIAKYCMGYRHYQVQTFEFILRDGGGHLLISWKAVEPRHISERLWTPWSSESIVSEISLMK